MGHRRKRDLWAEYCVGVATSGFLYTKENRAHWAASGAISDFLLTKGCVIAYTGQKAEMPRVQRHLYKWRSLATVWTEKDVMLLLDFGLKWLHLIIAKRWQGDEWNRVWIAKRGGTMIF